MLAHMHVVFSTCLLSCFCCANASEPFAVLHASCLDMWHTCTLSHVLQNVGLQLLHLYCVDCLHVVSISLLAASSSGLAMDLLLYKVKDRGSQKPILIALEIMWFDCRS